jgi:hypothetical protein
MDMEKLSASLNNQWYLDWFKTQAIRTRDKELTIIWQLC